MKTKSTKVVSILAASALALAMQLGGAPAHAEETIVLGVPGLTDTGGGIRDAINNATATAASGDTITVTGSAVAGITMGLTVPSGVRLLWTATFSNLGDYLLISGGGVFELFTGGSLTEAPIIASNIDVIVSGGTASATTSFTIGLEGTSSLTMSGGLIENTDDGDAIAAASSGEVTINDGTVRTTGDGDAIHANSTGNVTVTGGTVETSGAGNAVYATNAGTVTVTGGMVTSSASNGAIRSFGSGAILINGGTVRGTGVSPAINNGGTADITVTSGIVESTGTGSAIFTTGSGDILVNGGTVQATGVARAISAESATGTIRVSDGFVLAGHNNAIFTNHAAVTIDGGLVFSQLDAVLGAWGTISKITGSPTITAPGIVLAWDDTQTGPFVIGSSTALVMSPAGASATWARVGGVPGIAYANGTNTGFLPIAGVTLAGVCTIIDLPSGVLNGEEYDTVKEAVDALNALPGSGGSGAYIQMLTNSTEDEAITIEKETHLDLAGYTLDVDGSLTITADFISIEDSIGDGEAIVTGLTGGILNITDATLSVNGDVGTLLRAWDGAQITVDGDFNANHSDDALIYAWGGSQVTVTGSVTGGGDLTTALIAGGATITVGGSLSMEGSDVIAALALEDGSIVIGGDVTVTATGSNGFPAVWSVDSTIEVGGDVVVIGEPGLGAQSHGSGTITIEGSLAASPFIMVHDEYKAPEDREAVSSNPGYSEYTNNDAYVWIRGGIFTVTVIQDTGGTAMASPMIALAGTEIQLSVNLEVGYVFVGWDVSPASVAWISGDGTDPGASFTMPGEDVTVTAVYEYVGSGSDDGPGPYTGDTTNIQGWAALLFISFLGMLGVLASRRFTHTTV